MNPKASILIVDDDRCNVLILVKVLQDKYDTFTASSGLDAIEMVKEQRPDLILMDVVLPKLNGFESYRIIKADEMSANIPVIFMTASPSLADKNILLELGVSDYITKPVDFQLLETRIESILS